MKAIRQRHAFTLVEILVAISILTLILGVAYGTYAASTGSVSRCRAHIDAGREARAVLGRMTREIRCSYMRPAESVETPDGAEVLWEKRHPDFLGDDVSRKETFLEFLCSAGIGGPDAPTAGLAWVAYRFDEPGGILYRREASVVEDPESLADDEDWWPVAQEVQSVQAAFFDGKDWRDAWDSTERRELPRAVRFVIVLETADGIRLTFSDTAWAPCRRGDRARPRTQSVTRNERDNLRANVSK